MLELVRASNSGPVQRRATATEPSREKAQAADAGAIADVWEALKAFLLALGDDVQMRELEQYFAFRRLRNFACVKPRHKDLLVWAHVDPSTVPLEDGFTRDVSNIGHAGTGELEIRIQTAADLEKARPLLLRSYQGS